MNNYKGYWSKTIIHDTQNHTQHSTTQVPVRDVLECKIRCHTKRRVCRNGYMGMYGMYIINIHTYKVPIDGMDRRGTAEFTEFQHLWIRRCWV